MIFLPVGLRVPETIYWRLKSTPAALSQAGRPVGRQAGSQQEGVPVAAFSVMPLITHTSFVPPPPGLLLPALITALKPIRAAVQLLGNL